MTTVADQKISALTPVSLIPSTSTTVLQDGSGNNEQAPITGQSVQTSHSAVNYTSAGTQITQHLAGIDNALGGDVIVSLYDVHVSNKGGAGGTGTQANPFATRSEALDFIGSSATASNPYIIVYDAGSYTEATFPVFPNIFDHVPLPGSVTMTVTGASITADPSWASQTANYYLDGLVFDAATALNLDFHSLSGVIGAINLFNTNLTPAGAINGLNNSISLVSNNTTCPGGIVLTGLISVDVDNGDFSAIDVESGASSSECKASFNNNKSIGDVTLHTQGSAGISASFENSPATSYTLQAESKSAVTAGIDSSSWQTPNIVGGDVTVTRLTQAESILVQHNPVNYTPNPPGDPSVEAQIAGIDDALGGLGNNTVGFNAGQSLAVAPFTPQTIPNNVSTLVTFNSPQINIGGYYDPTLANSWFKPLVPGLYTVFAKVTFDIPTGTDGLVLLTLIKNGSFGSPVAATDLIRLPTTDAQSTATIPIIANVDMNGTTDYLQIYVTVTGNGGGALDTIAYPHYTYFGGSLSNQKASPVTPAVVTRTVSVSLDGSDVDGDGSASFPFETGVHATNFILANYTPTINNKVGILWDAGSYSETDLKVCPNIPWFSNGDVIINDTTNAIVLDSTWEGTSAATAAWNMQGIRIGDTTVPSFDTTGFTTIGGEITLKDSVWDREYVFKNNLPAHNLTLVNDNSQLGQASQADAVLDSVPFVGRNGFSMIAINNLQIFSSSRNTVLMGTGNQYRGGPSGSATESWEAFANTAYGIYLVLYAGNPISLAITPTTGDGTINFVCDHTTYSPVTNNGTTNFSIVNKTLSNVYTAQSLFDALTTQWNLDNGTNGLWNPAGNRTLAAPTGNDFYIGKSILLDINPSVNSAVITFNAAYVAPSGGAIPAPSATAGVSTLYGFVYNSQGNWELISCSAAGFGGSGTVNSGTVNKLAWYASTGTAVSGLATANNGVLATSASGVPAITTNFVMTSSQTIMGNASGALITGTGNALFGSGFTGLTTGTDNTIVGNSNTSNATNMVNSVIIGKGITGVGNNIVHLGNSSTAAIISLPTNGNCGLGLTNYPFGSLVLGTSSTSNCQITTASIASPRSYTIPDAGGAANFVMSLGTQTLSGTYTFDNDITAHNFTQTAGVLTIGNTSTTSIVGKSTTGGQYLGNSANPFGFLFLGTAANYAAIDTATQTTNGQTFAIPDAGSQPQNFALTSVTAVTGTSQAMNKWVVYLANNASLVTLTLPATLAQGDIFEVNGQGAGGWKIAQNSGQTIRWTSTLSTTTGVGGSLASTDQYDCIKLRALNSTDLVVISAKGNITVV